MEKTDIIKKIDTLYASDKSKNFVLHLVRAYLPVNKAKKVFFKPEDMKKLGWTVREMSGFSTGSGRTQKPKPQQIKPATYTMGDAGLAALRDKLSLSEKSE